MRRAKASRGSGGSSRGRRTPDLSIGLDLCSFFFIPLTSGLVARRYMFFFFVERVLSTAETFVVFFYRRFSPFFLHPHDDARLGGTPASGEGGLMLSG